MYWELRLNKRFRAALIVALLVGLWFGVRISNVDSTMTTDESLWHGRSANFYLALARGEYQHTYQMAHPGVPVMWAGGLGVLATCPEYIQADGFYVRDLAQSSESFREIGCDPLRVLVAERIAKIAVQAMMVAVSLMLLATIIPLKGIVFAGLLMVFSPWQAGLDQLLHVDGMFATASLVTVSAAAAMTVWCIRNPGRRWGNELAGWFFVGFALALAVLTRSAAVVYLVPVGIGIVAVTISDRRSDGRPLIGMETIRVVARSGMSVFVGCFVGVVALFPALWVTPGEVAERLLGFTDTAITEGHEHVLYYNGEIVNGDPGSLFYWDALIWRSTPSEWFVLGGISIFAGSLIVSWARGSEFGRCIPVSFWIVYGIALLFALLYATGITLAAKKFERYFIVASPLIAVVGGLVLAEGWRFFKRYVTQRVAIIVVMVLIGLQILSLAGARPYMLDYFNPIMGGHNVAVTKFQIGWGHGSDQVTSWLVHQHQDEPIRVRSSTTIGVFSVFVPMDSQVRFERGILDSASAWYHTDYYVSGIQQTQRKLDRSIHLFGARAPVHSVQVGDITYFETFAVNNQPIPKALWQQNACHHITASGVQLMAIEQQGRDLLVIVRVDDMELASGSWISIDDAHQDRLPIKSADNGMLVGVVFPDVSADEVTKIAIGGNEEASGYELPSGGCTLR